MPSSSEKVILISGANRGIGKEIALRLQEDGYKLSLGARDVDALAQVFGKQTDRLRFHHFDALNPQTSTDWVKQTVDYFGRIDGLINNAGSAEQVSLMDDDEEALDRLWAINVKAPLRMIRLCLPYLEKTGSGRIINLSSLSGKRVKNGFVGYNMTKFAVMGLTHTTRRVAWDKGVRTTAICPGFVKTDMSAYTDKVAPEDMTQPEDIATVVSTLLGLPNTASIAEILVNCGFEDTL